MIPNRTRKLSQHCYRLLSTRNKCASLISIPSHQQSQTWPISKTNNFLSESIYRSYVNIKGMDFYSLAKEQFRQAMYEIASVTGPVVDPLSLVEDSESLRRAVILFKSLEPNLDEIDDAESLWMLAELYSHGLGGLEKDGKKAIQYFEMGICLGSTKAALLYGIRLLYGVRGSIEVDEAEAFKYLKMAADEGDDAAQNIVGSMMCFGRSFKNPTTGVEYLKKSEGQHNLLAADNLGKAYEKGIGVTQSTQISFQYYMKAAVRGHPNSQFKVGEMYVHGRISTHLKDPKQEAVRWLLASSQGNCPQAQRLLGVMFRDGTGVQRDIDTAKRFLLMALDSGLMEAATDLIQLEQQQKRPSRRMKEYHARDVTSTEISPERELPRRAATNQEEINSSVPDQEVINFEDYIHHTKPNNK